MGWLWRSRIEVVSLPEFGKYDHTRGDSYEEALSNAKEVLEMLMEDSEALPEPQTYPVRSA